MTPTPEDIALAEKVTELIAESLNREHATYAQIAQPIADYCAPLRERIRELERFATPAVSTTANATSQVINHESVGTILGEKLRKKHQEREELAEIGRLAVEHQRAFRAGVWSTFASSLASCVNAADAYLDKHPTGPTP